MKFRANFCNGDYALFSEQSVIYYRKALITPKQFGYVTKIFNAGAELPFGPMLRALQIAVQHLSWQQIPGFDAKRFPIPVEKAFSFDDVDNGLSAYRKGHCSATGQAVNQYRADRDLVFQHPKHIGNEDRVYKVDKGTISGYMPWHAALSGCWVDESSFFSGTGVGTLITNHSRVIGSISVGNWIRKSLVEHSVLTGCVVQKASVLDCDLIDCGVRGATLEEVNGKKTSINGGTYGVMTVEDCRLHECKAVNAVVKSSNIDGGTLNSAQIVSCDLRESNICDSFLNKYKLDSTSVTASHLVARTVRELAYGMIVHDTPRIATYDPTCVTVTITEADNEPV